MRNTVLGASMHRDKLSEIHRCRHFCSGVRLGKYDKILDGFSQFPVQLVQWGQVYKRRKFIELSVMTLNRIYKNTDLPIIQHKIVLAYLLSEDKEYKDALELLKGMRSELEDTSHHVNTKSRPYCTSRLYASSFLTYHIPGRICLNCTKT